MKFGIVQFPGSNCDYDCYNAVKGVLGQDAQLLWHKETSLEKSDCIILPGGFTYGDYLRVGAIARYSPIMSSVIDFAQKGGFILGICNGFQVLTETGLLPGALIKNDCLHFICQQQAIRIDNNKTPFTCHYQKGQILQFPIAHGEGHYYASQSTIQKLETNQQIIFRYCDKMGHVTPEANPNGSVSNIAGICNKSKNVLGLMPHPERCMENCLGSKDGLMIFQSLLSIFENNISRFSFNQE